MKKIIIISAAILILLFILSFTLFKDFAINPFHTRTIVKTSIERVESLNISNYESIGYTYKTLFPYDFLIGEPNWGLILGKSGKFLSEEDLLNRDFYLKCKEIGVDLNRHKAFFIIETRAVAGFSVDSFIKDPVFNYDVENSKVVLHSPRAEILSIEVVDNLKKSNYPDVNISPKEWKEIIELVLPEIETNIIDSGILEKSDKRNRDFLTKIYEGIGWNKVEFK